MATDKHTDKERALGELTRGITRVSLLDGTKKTERLAIRITRNERAEIEGMCSDLDMSISEYLSGLHRHAYRQWSKRRKESSLHPDKPGRG